MITDINEPILRTLVLYVFHEYNSRVVSFFDNAVFFDENVDFIIIANQIYYEFNKKAFPPNVRFMNRENIGFDFGGWSDALLTNNLYKNYNYFIFVNSSVVGPFMNNYNNCKWTDIYINGLQENDIKLFGSTINCYLHDRFLPHVQSYIFSMNIITLEYLIKCEIFTMTNSTKTMDDTIELKEVLMSSKIIENNWNIGSLMNYYKDVDFRFKTKKLIDYNITSLGDIMYYEYIYKVWVPDELVFIKGNRPNLDNITI